MLNFFNNVTCSKGEIFNEKSDQMCIRDSYNAKEETMTLEDIFLYYFGEKTGDDYDVL